MNAESMPEPEPEPEPTLFDLARGEAAKDWGMARAGGSSRVALWRADALGAIHDLALTGIPFTADEVIAQVGLPGRGVNRNNAVGAMFSTAAKRGWIVKTGAYRKARRTASHSRILAVWVGPEGLDLP